MKEKLNIVKVGGAVVEKEESLAPLLRSFSALPGLKILVHGGGKIATSLAARLGIETQMIGGRRVTSAEMLEVVTMVYGGLVNKNLVARLQSMGIDAVGLTGADLDIIRSVRRPARPVDFGFVGDVRKVNAESLRRLLEGGSVPVLAPLTHDGKGCILNTNGDTIASSVAVALSEYFDVTLTFCSSTPGVMADLDNPDSLIRKITPDIYRKLVLGGAVSDGMIPKLQNAFEAIGAGVSRVVVTSASDIAGGTEITGRDGE
ncbi:MAG: acetylglutamate kinase [Candidatus Cryptobacteroides sp.]